METKKVLSSLAIVGIGTCLACGSLASAQTKQLKEPASAPKIAVESDGTSDAQGSNLTSAPNGSSSYSVVIENHTTSDGKVIQTKKVWSNGNLVQEEEKELSPEEAQKGFDATVQLPNGQIAPGGIFQSEDSEDIFGDNASPFDAIRKMEEQLRIQQERMRAQFEALRNQLANGQNVIPPAGDEDFQNVAPQTVATPSKYWIGLTIGAIPQILAEQLPIDETEGVLVQYVVPDSPAAKIGLKRFDVIHSIDGHVVSNPSEVTKLVNSLGSKKVGLEYYRKGKLEKSEIEIEERPQNLGNRLNLGVPLQNKKFQVVRPGVIVPSDVLDKSDESSSSADQAEISSEPAPASEQSENNAEVQTNDKTDQPDDEE